MAADNKSVTSLLLFSIVPRDRYRDFAAAYAVVSREHGDRSALPDIQVLETSSDEMKCMLDFSTEIDSAVAYDLSIANVMQAHEGFICEFLAIDRRCRCYLSAQISVDSALAVFELRSPRILKSINAFDNFGFDYSVWHHTPDT